jgi:hypothetical protein
MMSFSTLIIFGSWILICLFSNGFDDFPREIVVEKCLPLEDKKNKAKRTVTGKVHIRFLISQLPVSILFSFLYRSCMFVMYDTIIMTLMNETGQSNTTERAREISLLLSSLYKCLQIWWPYPLQWRWSHSKSYQSILYFIYCQQQNSFLWYLSLFIDIFFPLKLRSVIPFSHVGIILKLNNKWTKEEELYVVEATRHLLTFIYKYIESHSFIHCEIHFHFSISSVCLSVCLSVCRSFVFLLKWKKLDWFLFFSVIPIISLTHLRR